MKKLLTLLTAASLVGFPVIAAAASAVGSVRNVVLVHGAFADGSGWRAVADILTKDGYKVSVVQEPLTSVEDDVIATNRILDRQQGPAVLVGHSYGGVIITAAGNNPHVASLVYVAAYAPDEGQTIASLITDFPSKGKGIGPTADGYLLIDPARFPTDFAADLPLADAQFMALAQVPWNAKSVTTPVPNPAWKSKPSYAVVATDDRTINPDLQRAMYKHANAKVTEIKGSHAVFISQPRAVANVIEQAARESH
ncbi:MAG: alpha/beta fold hydrolase [Massilia sp.]